MTSIQSNHHISEGDHGFKLSATPTLCAPMLLEPSPIMRQLGNTTSGSSQMNISVVHAMNTLSRLEDTFYMSVEDSMGTGTLREIR